MKKAQIVSFHCVLKDKVGNVISRTFNQDVITSTGCDGEMLQDLADGMQDLKKGERRRIYLPAERAYGFYDPQLVIQLPRKTFEMGKNLEVGSQIQVLTEAGESKLFKVIQSTADTVTLDGNHPLAGQDLIFEIEATDAREASSEELSEARQDLPKPTLH